MLIIHVPSDASESEYSQARETLALAFAASGGEVVSSPREVPSAVVSVQPAKGSGIPAKGSPEAKARMARARAGKAGKAQSSPTSAPKASDRLAELAAKAGIAATPAPKAPKAPKASSQRYILPEHVADTTDADESALESLAGNLVDQRKLTALVLYLQGKASATELEAIASRTGTLRSHAERAVSRARRGEDS